MPMFIARGGHLKREVPEMLTQLRLTYPEVEFSLADAIGEQRNRRSGHGERCTRGGWPVACLVSCMLTVLVIDESRSRAGEICAGLALAGYQVAAILAGSENLTAEVEKLQPDVILIDTDSPSRDTLENLAAMNKNMPRPVVIFTQEDGQATIRDAVKAGVSAYIVDGLDPKRIKPIVEVARARFEDTQALRRELDEISQKLSDRKLVDKAKGVLMKARGLDEDAAYHAMRKLAMERGQTMAKVARDVIDMARVLL